MNNLYDVLGVSKEATSDEIKSAYRKLALKYHPDRYDGIDGPDKFREATEAYETLSDENKRRDYDNPGRFGGFGGFDIFGNFGNGMWSQRPSGPIPQRGRTVSMAVSLSVYEAVVGTDRTIEYDLKTSCTSCEKPCESCGGRGVVVSQNNNIMLTSPCRQCSGSGKTTGDSSCTVCEGSGIKKEHRKVELHFPPGTETGNKFGVNGAGFPGINGGQDGPLIAEVVIKLPNKESLTEEELEVLKSISNK